MPKTGQLDGKLHEDKLFICMIYSYNLLQHGIIPN